jgi:hypothetical protein
VSAVAAAAGAADAVDVVFVAGRHVVVDDVRHSVDVQSAGGHVGGDEDAQTSVTEALERALALSLGHVAVDGAGPEAALHEVFAEAFGAALGAGEDDDLAALRLDEDVVEVFHLLLAAVDVHHVLVDVLGGRARLDGHGDRVLEELDGQVLGAVLHGGREEERLALFLHERQQVLDILHEAHVEHAVDFVEDDVAEAGEVEVAALDEVLGPSRRADDEARAAAQVGDLAVHMGAADADGGAQAGAEGEVAELLVDLDGQLAGRDQDEHLFLLAVEHLVDQRDEEGGRLAGAGIGDADDVAAVEDVRNGSVLDRSRMHELALGDIGLELLVDLEVLELVLGLEGDRLGRLDSLAHELGDVEGRPVVLLAALAVSAAGGGVAVAARMAGSAVTPAVAAVAATVPAVLAVLLVAAAGHEVASLAGRGPKLGTHVDTEGGAAPSAGIITPPPFGGVVLRHLLDAYRLNRPSKPLLRHIDRSRKRSE